MRLSFILLACLLISTVSADHFFLKGKGIFKDHQAYSKQKQRVVQTDLYGNQTQYEYDMFNQLVKIVHPPIPKPTRELFYPTEKFYYDTHGYINEKQDGNYNITCQFNTAGGKPYLIQYPDGSLETMAYTPEGNLAEKVEKNGVRIRYRYDDQGRILSREFLAPSGESLGMYTYAYSLTLRSEAKN